MCGSNGPTCPWLGTFRVGQWKQPFSLEVVSSFRYTTFMERSSMFQAFTPFRHIAAGFYNHSQDLNATWAASLLRTGQDQFGGSISTVGGNGFSGRMTHLMWYDEAEGRDYLHVGGAYYLNSPPNHTIAFRSIPEIFVGQNRADASTNGTAGFGVPLQFDGTPFFVNTGNLTGVEHVHTFGLEALWVRGPLSVQAEGMTALVDRSVAPTAALEGAYVQVGWFLTGEHRPYDRIAGAIDRVKPFEDFFWVRTDCGLERGLGAWEVALRFSHINLNDTSGQISGRADEQPHVRHQLVLQSLLQGGVQLHPFVARFAHIAAQHRNRRQSGRTASDDPRLSNRQRRQRGQRLWLADSARFLTQSPAGLRFRLWANCLNSGRNSSARALPTMPVMTM